MNEDDYWVDALRNNVYRSTYDYDWTWTINQAKQMDSSLPIEQIYEMLRKIEDYNRKDADMGYSYGRGYYNDTRGDEVATIALEAYANGVEFETLIQKNRVVRQYWYQIQSEKAQKEKSRLREEARLAKLAEKRAEEKAKREDAMSKLSQEELEAFGLAKPARKVTKR